MVALHLVARLFHLRRVAKVMQRCGANAGFHVPVCLTDQHGGVNLLVHAADEMQAGRVAEQARHIAQAVAGFLGAAGYFNEVDQRQPVAEIVRLGEIRLQLVLLFGG